jgi:serine/threonine protein phosphatase PrpC
VTGLFQRLRPKKQTKKEGKSTKPLPKIDIQLPVNDLTQTSMPEESPPQFLAAYAQSVGKQRDHNEDALLVISSSMSSDTRQIPFGLYIVADGMGGYQHGEIASAVAVRALGSFVMRRLYLPFFSLNDQTPDEPVQEVLQEGVQEANQAIVRYVNGGGTTLTAVLILGEKMTIAHVGDSRAYIIHPGKSIEGLTRDHSLVKRLEELGQITPEEAAVHPQRNVLYRALGQGEPFDADILTTQVPSGGLLLLCSDGLWGQVPQEKIRAIVESTPELKVACQKLVAAANDAGGPDNISAILVQLPA